MVPLTASQVVWYKQLLSGLDSSTVEAVMRESASSVPTEEASATATAAATDSRKITAAAAAQSSAEPLGSGITDLSAGAEAPSGAAMSDGDWRRLMNLLLQLRKLCNHVYLMPGAAPDPYEVDESLVQGSGKLRLLDRMLPRLREDGHRVLIFSQFTSTLDLLDDYCEYRRFPYVRLDG